MGYAGKIDLQIAAKNLRKNGFSIKAIEKKLKISRSSASIWTRDIELTKKQLARLYSNKRTGAWRGCLVAALQKKENTKILNAKATQDAYQEIGTLSDRNRLIAGIALYFGEGNKSGTSIGFTNSDPRALIFMIEWFRKFFKVPENKFTCSIYIHDNLNEQTAKEYWSKLVRVPLKNFRKSYIVKNNPNRFRKTKHIYGILRITICDMNLYRRIIGLISAVFPLY